ncbi:MAG: cofactor-independent phosphoglycerate mutase [Phycisphaerae bacterium]|nr:cofactor-independent phosphoglycerate mutase [Phycisphaerae bacterium]
MKYALIIPDGAADEPVEELDGQTPLEAADIPNIDWISTNGLQGCLRTVPEGFTAASDVATLSVMGYDPATNYAGRAPLEAAARGIKTGADDLIFRCNLVTVLDEKMQDFTAGHISTKEAERLIADLRTLESDLGVVFHTGMSYRHLLVMRDATEVECECTPPHDIPGEPVEGHLPSGSGYERVREVMQRAQALLADHEVNQVRRDLGENPATDIWLWGQGRHKPLETFEARFGLRGVCIAAVDLIRGIAKNAGLTNIAIPGATGYLDTDYGAKGRAAVVALDECDLVLVHVEAPDEAGHLGDAAEKIKALEQIDAEVVCPILSRLRQFDQWKIAVVPDHPTPISTRKHSKVPPPFCIAGSGISASLAKPFSEKQAAASDLQIDPGHEFMEFFLKP